MVDYACEQKKKDVPKVLAQQVRLQTDDGRKQEVPYRRGYQEGTVPTTTTTYRYHYRYPHSNGWLLLVVRALVANNHHTNYFLHTLYKHWLLQAINRIKQPSNQPTEDLCKYTVQTIQPLLSVYQPKFWSIMNEVFTAAANEFRQKAPQLTRKLEVRSLMLSSFTNYRLFSRISVHWFTTCNIFIIWWACHVKPLLDSFPDVTITSPLSYQSHHVKQQWNEHTRTHTLNYFLYFPIRYRRLEDCTENPSNSSDPGQSTAKSSSTKPKSSAPDSKTADPPMKPKQSVSSKKQTRRYSKILIPIRTVCHLCPVGRCLWGILLLLLKFVFRMGIIRVMLPRFCLILIWVFVRRRRGRIMMGLFWWISQKRIWNKYEWIYNIGGTCVV